MTNLLAQINIAPSGGFKGLGTGPLANPGTGAVGIFSKFISGVIGVLTIVAILWAIFSIITGAISIISSGGINKLWKVLGKKLQRGLSAWSSSSSPFF
jgi:hypothetical protein